MFKFIWVVGFGELVGSAGEPQLGGTKKVLPRHYDITLGTKALTVDEQPLGLGSLRSGWRLSGVNQR